jgi:hypothetical protein
VVLLMLAAAAGAASPADPLAAALRTCRALPDREARFACYEAIALDAAAPLRPAPAAARTTETVPAAPAASVPGATPDAVAAFGLPAARAAGGTVASIRARLGPELTRWEVGTRIRLDNGQVWEVIDGIGAAVGPDQREVTVRRGAMGSFFLDFAGTNHSARVRRVQ